MTSNVEERLLALGLRLSTLVPPRGSFRPAVLRERGEHARSAIGVASLPKGFAVEIEAIVEFA
jgi:hypothetical protein